jgi:hypothetical protein
MRRWKEKQTEKIQKGEVARVEIDGDFGEYRLDNLECHEAGFDALMTGYSFLRGAAVLTNNNL